MAVIKADPECTWKTRCVSSIEGRRVDMIYATDGTPLSPHTWSVYMWQFDRLRQYQFIQYDRKTYTLKVNGAKGIYADEELIGMLKNVLGPDADITIEHVDEIPVLSSGKFKKTISLYQPNLLREDI
jgi:phenylacetate-CoA ligase